MANLLLTQCVNLVNKIVEKDMMAFINIQVGDNFSFVFDNKKYSPREPKKKSPSQEKRNIERTINFIRKNEQNDDASRTANEKEKSVDKDFVKVKNEIEINSEKEEAKLEEVFCDSITMEPQILVEKILVTADCQADWNDKYVTKLVNEKLNIIGIRMKSIQVNRNIRKCFESCVVTIEPTKKKIIEQESFPIRRWTMKCIS